MYPVITGLPERFRRPTEVGFCRGFPMVAFGPDSNLLRIQIWVALVNGLDLLPQRQGNPALLAVYVDRQANSQLCPQCHGQGDPACPGGQYSGYSNTQPQPDGYPSRCCSGGLSNSGTSAARPPAAASLYLLSLNLPQFILNLSQDIERQARYHETMSIKLYLAPSQA